MKHIARLYLLGKLTEEDEAAFEAHVMECSSCRHQVIMASLGGTVNISRWIPFGSRLLPPISRMPLN
jgi:hypothetical protein